MDNKTLISFLVFYIKKHFFKLLSAMLFMLASSGLNVIPPYLFKTVVDDVLISKNIKMLNIICGAIILIFGLKAVTTYFQRYLMTQAGQSIVMDIRIALYDHMQRMSLKKIYASRIGELMSRITGDVSTLQNIVTSTIIDLLFNLVTFWGMFAFILYINWKLTCLIVLALPVVGLMLSFTSKKLRQAGHKVQEHLADITATAQEAFSAIRVVRSFAMEDEELERFRMANQDNYMSDYYCKDLNERYGEGFTISVKLDDPKKLDETETKAIKLESGVNNINNPYKVETEVTFSGSVKTETADLTIYVSNQSGSYKIFYLKAAEIPFTEAEKSQGGANEESSEQKPARAGRREAFRMAGNNIDKSVWWRCVRRAHPFPSRTRR